MRTFIFWNCPLSTPRNNKAYKGVVGGLMWDQFLVGARAGHGYCYLIDAETPKKAKALLDSAEQSSQPSILTYGEKAKQIVQKFLVLSQVKKNAAS
jgi:hypothetical protein